MATTTQIKCSHENIKLIANYGHKGALHFRIIKKINKDGHQIETIKCSSLIRSIFYRFSKNHSSKINKLIQRDIRILSSLDESYFVDMKTHAVTDLFLSVQKYNQSLLRQKEIGSDSVFSKLDLPLIAHQHIPEINPLKVTISKTKPFNEDIKKNYAPYLHRTGFLKKRTLFRYDEQDAQINHGAEAGRIFISTQKERLKCVLGQLVNLSLKPFGAKLSVGQKYQYFRHNEQLNPNNIYDTASPFTTQPQPSSYWLGHATCLMNIPLTSTTDSTKKASIHVITDPIEGDLNKFLYPRKTKFAKKMEDCPAPHIYLLSHNHLDHYSKPTIRKLLSQQPVMIVPEGDGHRYKKLGFTNVIEQNWWDKTNLQFERDGHQFKMAITAVPAHHWAGQGPCGGHESAFLGYIIQGMEEGDLYFAGDTARLSQAHIDILKDQFNIRWMFEPGGPDEVRKEMESTHQASVDGLWMHFNLMIRKVRENHSNKKDFLKACKNLKTIYMHTKTFKLGNLHFDDTETSVEKVLEALELTKTKTSKKILKSLREAQASLKSSSGIAIISEKLVNRESLIQKLQEMKDYERQVYEELLRFTAEMNTFEGNKRLTPREVAKLLRETVVIPKIGSRTMLTI